MTRATPDDVANRARDALPATIERLSSYLRIPAISCEPERADDVWALARRVRDDLDALGLERARVLEVDGALPCVAAEWMQAGDDRPTVLVYGHLDLQPAVLEEWTSPPHEPVRRGDRLYARGAADDMGGWVSHLAAVQAWLGEAGGLPCNLRLIIEGEEEIGSPNLLRYMDAYPEAFEAQVMILTDCDNPSVDLPGLTVSLRGLMEVELRCEALDADVHSGLWGNVIPDVSTALMSLVARLVDRDGRPTVGRVDTPAERRSVAAAVPMDLELIRKGGHLLDGIEPLPERGVPGAEWAWWQPAITVVATDLPRPDQKKNALRKSASATLSVRLGPEQRAEDMLAAMKDLLLADPPGGVRVSVEPRGFHGSGWLYHPRGPAFAAADRAYEKAWGAPLQQVGVGGSIPFVAMFAERYGDLPLILNGVMDPETTAHGPDESLHLGVFEKAVVANVHLYSELGALGSELGS
jgi:acetylornithine deacetylase/succinyl-diaminopimelate desuccinylase-like protein